MSGQSLQGMWEGGHELLLLIRSWNPLDNDDFQPQALEAPRNTVSCHSVWGMWEEAHELQLLIRSHDPLDNTGQWMVCWHEREWGEYGQDWHCPNRTRLGHGS